MKCAAAPARRNTVELGIPKGSNRTIMGATAGLSSSTEPPENSLYHTAGQASSGTRPVSPSGGSSASLNGIGPKDRPNNNCRFWTQESLLGLSD